MVSPVTGPFVTTSGSRTALHYKRISSFRQKKPYNLVCELDHRQAQYTLSHGKFTYFNPGQGTDWAWGIANSTAEAVTDNACYSAFIGKMRAQNASLGITLAEHSSARKMLTDRSKQMLGLAVALAKRDFKTAFKIATKDGRDGPSKTRSMPKTLSNLYLEWSWGWRPMVEDINNSLETLVDPVTPFYVRASRMKEDNWVAFHSRQVGNYGGKPYEIIRHEDWRYNYKVSTGAQVTVNNPNVAMANRLGLINLPQIIWAVQPFSFIVDKYVNIGQMLGSFSDTYGFTLSQPWQSRKVAVSSSGFNADSRIGFELTENYHANGSFFTKVRKNGLLGPTLTLRSPSIGSFGEAASYMALLTQILTGKGK